MPQFRAVPLVVAVSAAAFGCAASSRPQDPNTPTAISIPGTTPTGWLTHTDAANRFAVSYPADLGILREATSPPSGAATRVRFQDTQIISSQFAELEPPRFTVEVFNGRSGTSLEDWLRSVNRLPVGATITRVTLAGATDAMRVQQRQQLAPNEFYYVAAGDKVYVLTPLGGFSADMLASFRLL